MNRSIYHFKFLEIKIHQVTLEWLIIIDLDKITHKILVWFTTHKIRIIRMQN